MEPRRRPTDKCSWHNANCVERPLSRLFHGLGRLVATYPWPFLLAPVLLTAGLGSGFQRLQQLKADNIEEQFTPLRGPAKAERDVVRLYFPTDDATRFSAPRLPTEGAYAALIAVAAEGASVLEEPALSEVRRLDADVRALGAYERLCARSGGACVSPAPLLALLPAGGLGFPLHNGTFLGATLGGVRTDGSERLLGARAIKLRYDLREGAEAERWLGDFIRLIPELLRTENFRAIEVSYFTSLSRQEEFEENTKTVIPLFSITYFLTITFSIVSCLRQSCIRNNIWIASFGVLSAGLAVVSSFGLMLYCGVPFVITVANAPFLILGVGVDDMFIIIACWEKSVKEAEKSDTKARMAETYTEAAVSVTITTLTDVLAFFIGTWTAFPSVKSFCLYTGTAFIFCYVYTLTFLGAVLVLNHKREKKNRHWLTFMPVKTDEDKSKSSLYNVCCIGNCSGQSPESEPEHPISTFFERYYGPFITNKWVKLLVVLLYGVYVGGSVYGCTQVKEGIDLRNLANDDSYVVPYYNDDDKYFSEYGPRVMVVVNGSVEYWNESVRVAIQNCLQSLEDISYVDKNLSESWLAVYTKIAQMASININNKENFIRNLSMLFQFYPDFEWDINKTKDEIKASRFFIQTVNVTTAVDEKNLLNKLRDTAEQCSLPVMLYHPAFIYYDQYLVIVQNTIQNVLIAAGAMLVVSLLLIPNPFCCLWVTFAIASVIIGVAGFMTFWLVNLDSISMINLVICIGFSVDFSAHISYAFVSSEKASANERAIDALHMLGYPVLQGAISTILGVAVLAAAKTYIFRTFFKIMFLVILFGALHGLVFIPVFLTFFGSFRRSHPDPVPEEGLKTETRYGDDKDCP